MYSGAYIFVNLAVFNLHSFKCCELSIKTHNLLTNSFKKIILYLEYTVPVCVSVAVHYDLQARLCLRMCEAVRRCQYVLQQRQKRIVDVVAASAQDVQLLV